MVTSACDAACVSNVPADVAAYHVRKPWNSADKSYISEEIHIFRSVVYLLLIH